MPKVNYIGWNTYPLSFVTSNLNCNNCETTYCDDFDCKILSFDVCNDKMNSCSEGNKLNFSKTIKINNNNKLTMQIKISDELFRKCVCGGIRKYSLCNFVNDIRDKNFSIEISSNGENGINKTFEYNKNEINIEKSDKWIYISVEYISHNYYEVEELCYTLNFDEIELENCCCNDKSNPINYAYINLFLEKLKDSDCDGIPDIYDNEPCDSSDLELKDTDGDNVPDLFDKNPYDSNCSDLVDPKNLNDSNVLDTDGDKIPDIYDDDENDGTNVELKDIDSNNIPDVFEQVIL